MALIFFGFDSILKSYPREPRYKSILSSIVRYRTISVHILRVTLLINKVLIVLLGCSLPVKEEVLAGEVGS